MNILMLFGIFLICIFVSMPIGFSMLAATILTMFLDGQGNALITILTKAFAGASSSTMLAIPFFMLAGSIMEHGGISDRIIKFASGLVGHLRGGLALVSVLVSMIFAGVSGSAVADTTAVGSVMMPAMNRKGYEKGFVASLQACAGTIGPIIPPSINMVIVASMTGESVANLFLAGIIPGILIGFCLMVTAYIYAKQYNIPLEPKMPKREVWDAFKSSVWALLTPVIILGGIMSGWFTATEAGMISVVYSLFVGIFVYRELTFKKFLEVLKDSVAGSAQIMFLCATANVFAWILTRMGFGGICASLLTGLTSSSTVFLLIIMGFFLIVGCFIEITAALMIFVPVLYPIATSFGIGFPFLLIVLMTMAIGQITPPVGVLLSLTAEMQKIKLTETFRFLPRVLAAMLIADLLCVFIPQLITILPTLLGTLT